MSDEESASQYVCEKLMSPVSIKSQRSFLLASLGFAILFIKVKKRSVDHWYVLGVGAL